MVYIYFQEESDDHPIADLQTLIQNPDKMKHCRVLRSYCLGCIIYFHHFIILSVNESKMVVAHYSSTFGFTGRFILQTYKLAIDKPNKPCDILDFEKGVYIVQHPAERRGKIEAKSCLVQRLNESLYNTNVNNCEHIVNDILYRTEMTNQADTRVCITNIIGSAINLMPNVSIQLCLSIFLIASMISTLARRSFNQILLSALLFPIADEGNETCDISNVGQNILGQLSMEVEKVKEVMLKLNYTFGENARDNITAMLDNSIVCKFANEIAEWLEFQLVMIPGFFLVLVELIMSVFAMKSRIGNVQEDRLSKNDMFFLPSQMIHIGILSLIVVFNKTQTPISNAFCPLYHTQCFNPILVKDAAWLSISLL